MTVIELYEQALAVMPTNPSEDDSLRQYMVGWVNLLMAETLKYQNAVLMAKGETPLEMPSKVTALADNIPYAPHLAENAFIWGIASFMCKDDEDTFHEQDFRGRYISACQEYTPLVVGTVVNAYRSGIVDA